MHCSVLGRPRGLFVAGDWIKVTTVFPEKPEVWQIASDLSLDADAVVGKLIRVLIWFDSHSEDGNAPGVTAAFLDRHVGVTGFVEAMKNVGWIEVEGSEIVLKDFDKHNGNSAKKRALGRNRSQKHRNASGVTKASPEKRREEGYKNKNNNGAAEFSAPSLQEVEEYARLCNNAGAALHFFNYNESRGWLIAGNPMKDWRAAFLNYKVK